MYSDTFIFVLQLFSRNVLYKKPTIILQACFKSFYVCIVFNSRSKQLKIITIVTTMRDKFCNALFNKTILYFVIFIIAYSYPGQQTDRSHEGDVDIRVKE